MGLLNGMGAFRLPKLGGSNVSGALKPFRDVLRLKDFMSADVAVTAGKWNDVGEVEVGAQQIVNVGFGSEDRPENAGFIYCKLMNTSAAVIDGKFRIIAKDANEVGKDTIFNEDLDSLGGDANDKQKQIMLEEHPTQVLKDEKIVLQVMPDTTTTIDISDAGTKLKIPITRRYTKQK
jgi:hypothetical protein